MSVNCQKPSSSLKSLLPLLRSCMGRQLAQYRAYFCSAQNQIVNTLQMYVLQQKNQSMRQQQTIQQLQKQILQLKEDNSFLRNQYMIAVLRGQQLEKSRDEAVKDAEGKEARVRELAEQVDNFKESVLDLEQDDSPADFDAESPIKGARFEGLEVIKQVSQHDLSVSMSLQSCTSGLFETRTPSEQIQPVLGDYHDALQILKSYTNSSRPLSLARSDSDKKRNSKKNDTISRIKRMRKIEDHPLDNQQNICSIGNDASELQDGCNNQQIQSSVSLISHKFHSRIKQSLMSLEDPVKLVKETLDSISVTLSKPQKRLSLQEGYIKLGYAGGLDYLGRSDSIRNPSGFGKLLLNGECIYQGQWRNGLFHGWGKLILLAFGKDKQRRIIQLDGHFKGGIADGSVVCTFNNGERFMGLMRDGSLERQGSFVGERGVLTGVWEGSRLIYLL